MTSGATRNKRTLALVPEIPRATAGVRERGSSPWLGRPAGTPEKASAWRELERLWAASGWWPSLAIAPATAAAAVADWAVHLAAEPVRQAELAQLAWQEAMDYAQALGSNERVSETLPQDKRFANEAWQSFPYSAVARAFLLQQHWWEQATTGVPGVSRHHEQMMAFAARQCLDTVSPSNFVSLNPVIQQRTLAEGGANLLRGMMHFLQDAGLEALDQPPAGAEAFQPGRNVAITPGRVVCRTPLMELIQYEPTTTEVKAEPILIVPAWIMKYYILDLSPANSMIKYLVDHGYTVFAISWKNPGESDRDLGMASYDHLGVRAALETIDDIVPGSRVHAVGYCLGGTLLATVAAALGRDGEDRIRSLTLLAAQTDFADPGELGLFIDESQVAHLEKIMAPRGYLDKRQMRGTFQMLRSNDLIWSYRLTNYLLGDRPAMTDLMAWNADGTRLPYRMHLEYLRGMYLRNALARGEWEVDGKPVNLADIKVPIFNVGTVQDHVAPWRSVFKLHALTDAPQTFLLTAGGHNVGIVNPPGQARSSYRMLRRSAGDRLLTPDEWLEAATPSLGSWWPAWVRWLGSHSSGTIAPPVLRVRPSLGAAPGHYVMER